MANAPSPESAVQNLALTDDEVASRVCAGETALFEILMRRHNQRLYRAVRAVLKSDAEAEDALQQAWLSAYTHLAQFAGQASLAAWLTRIALHEAFARTRKRHRLAEVEWSEEGDEMREPASHTSPEERASSRELTGVIEAAIDGLAEGYREVFTLRAVQELSTAETAACLEVSEEVVKVRLHRARVMLRHSLVDGANASLPEAFAFMGPRCDRIVARVFEGLQRLAPPLPPDPARRPPR